MSHRSAADRLRAAGQPIGELYLGRDEIAARVTELGREIAAAYTGRVPLLVAPLKSSAVFLADLSRAALDQALREHRASVAKSLRRRRIERHEHDAALDRLDAVQGTIGFQRSERGSTTVDAIT